MSNFDTERKKNQNGPKRTKMDQKGPNEPKLTKNGPITNQKLTKNKRGKSFFAKNLQNLSLGCLER